MATPDTTSPADDPCERDEALEAAGAEIGALRNPDGCVLLCPACTCRRLLEQRRAVQDGQR